MVIAVTQANAHLFGDALASQYRLRHRAFKERQDYDTQSYRGMEYDQYDTPAAVYLLWRDEREVVRGMMRLTPTDRPYMLRDLWPEIVTRKPLPSSRRVWEGTRCCVDHEFADGPLRRRILSEIVVAQAEYCFDEEIESVVGVMPPLIWRSVFVRAGWSMDELGERHVLEDGSTIVAGELPVGPGLVERLRKKAGLQERVLERLDLVPA